MFRESDALWCWSLVLFGFAASASAFAPALSTGLSSRKACYVAPAMQTGGKGVPLFKDGIEQGAGMTAKYIGFPFKAPRPDTPAFDGTWVGDVGFDPLGISTWVDVRWLREAELKHGRICMLAATGMIVQDIFRFPGVEEVMGAAKMTELHDVAVTKGTMQQLFFWLGFLEIFSFIAIAQMMRGEIDRMPGDYYFDPLNCAKNPSAFARRQLVEIKNGRLAMIATSGMLHHYFITGKGPIELIFG